MNYENDFAKEETVNLNVTGYKDGDFKYKPTSAGEELDWLPEYMEKDEDGKPKQNYAKLNKLKFNNLQAVPYNKELINKLIKIDKDWKELNIDERWNLLKKLRGPVFDQILNGIRNIDNGDTSAKKP